MSQLLAQVQQDGATIVVGPLLKDNVEDVIKSNTSLNVLALNQPEKVESRANICYFALSPEDEARDAAHTFTIRANRLRCCWCRAARWAIGWLPPSPTSG
jgi:outer membrane PBP1 activator LpoA protein